MSSVGSRVLWAAAGAATLVSATPFPRDLVHDVVDGFSHLLLARGNDCGAGAGLCGANNQYCCGPGQVCTTVAGNVATCVAGAAPGAGLYGLYTTTWTETRTYTSTIMTHWAPAPEPTAGVDCVPPSAEQQACGPICCAGWQTCAFQGQCSIRPGYAEPSTVLVTRPAPRPRPRAPATPPPGLSAPTAAPTAAA
ncbi:hypothetical protein CDD83_2663 [Cordyceps sp. RAO-2017]|nr:hypothetical protein CDD83_2663 [Cordyceps sp. RAO-2017]